MCTWTLTSGPGNRGKFQACACIFSLTESGILGPSPSWPLQATLGQRPLCLSSPSEGTFFLALGDPGGEDLSLALLGLQFGGRDRDQATSQVLSLGVCRDAS